jgi:hypothetical protein
MICCRIWSCAAFSIGAYGEEQLAGFITAKKVHLYECDITVGLAVWQEGERRMYGVTLYGGGEQGVLVLQWIHP